jgi:hypothetical protein
MAKLAKGAAAVCCWNSQRSGTIVTADCTIATRGYDFWEGQPSPQGPLGKRFRLRLFNHNVFQLVEMLNCYRKHIEADGGSQNYRGQGKPHVPLPKIRGRRTMVTPALNETQASMFGSRQRSWPNMKTVVAGCEFRIYASVMLLHHGTCHTWEGDPWLPMQTSSERPMRSLQQLESACESCRSTAPR